MVRVIGGDNFSLSSGHIIYHAYVIYYISALYAGVGYTRRNTVFPSVHFVNASAHLTPPAALHEFRKKVDRK